MLKTQLFKKNLSFTLAVIMAATLPPLRHIITSSSSLLTLVEASSTKGHWVSHADSEDVRRHPSVLPDAFFIGRRDAIVQLKDNYYIGTKREADVMWRRSSGCDDSEVKGKVSLK